MRETNHSLTSSDLQLQFILNASPVGIMVFNDREEITLANPPAEKLFGLSSNTDSLQRCGDLQYAQLFREMLNAFALHEILCDDQGKPVDYRFLAVNPAFERMTGLATTQVIGRTALEVLPGIEPHWIETYGRVALTGQPVHFEHYSVEIGKHFSINAFCPAPGQFACLFEDVTEREPAKEELEKNEANYRSASALLRSLCDNVPDMIWAKDLDKRYLSANAALCRGLLNAVDTEEPIGKSDLYFAERERASHTDQPQWYTFGEICCDSDTATMDADVPMQFDEFGNVRGKFLFLDVHKAPFIDPNGTIVTNQRWVEMLDLTAEEVEPHIRFWESQIHPDDLHRVTTAIVSHCKGATANYQTEHRIRNKSGECVWVLDKGRVVERDARGTPLRSYGTHLVLGQHQLGGRCEVDQQQGTRFTRTFTPRNRNHTHGKHSHC